MDDNWSELPPQAAANLPENVAVQTGSKRRAGRVSLLSGLKTSTHLLLSLNKSRLCFLRPSLFRKLPPPRRECAKTELSRCFRKVLLRSFYSGAVILLPPPTLLSLHFFSSFMDDFITVPSADSRYPMFITILGIPRISRTFHDNFVLITVPRNLAEHRISYLLANSTCPLLPPLQQKPPHLWNAAERCPLPLSPPNGAAISYLQRIDSPVCSMFFVISAKLRWRHPSFLEKNSWSPLENQSLECQGCYSSGTNPLEDDISRFQQTLRYKTALQLTWTWLCCGAIIWPRPGSVALLAPNITARPSLPEIGQRRARHFFCTQRETET
ncbi:hypothetical protein J6590_054573 [Homalodisca vitripennis]|nr:hypothetical protein J6590_054573 [Homalodisca vitripennis]